MLLRMSSLFLRTLRDDPADAEVPSHRLLVRAGYIRRAAPGGFTWLPLGLKVLRNVERVVREEMDRIGAHELLLPALLPREPYETTGRWTEYGPDIFRLQDRRGAADVAGADQQPVARDLGVGRVVAQRAHEEARHPQDLGSGHAGKATCGGRGGANEIRT